MANYTQRKLMKLISFLATLFIAWSTGATSNARNVSDQATDFKSSNLDKISRYRFSSELIDYSSPNRLSLSDHDSALRKSAGDQLAAATYGNESPTARDGAGREPARQNLYWPSDRPLNLAQEQAVLQNMLNTKPRIVRLCADCESNALQAPDCVAAALRELESSLVREAARGSTVAQASLPVVREVIRDVRRAQNGQAAAQAIRRGISKMERINVVRSQDTAIVSLQTQQRTVLQETLQAAELSLAKAISI